MSIVKVCWSNVFNVIIILFTIIRYSVHVRMSFSFSSTNSAARFFGSQIVIDRTQTTMLATITKSENLIWWWRSLLEREFKSDLTDFDFLFQNYVIFLITLQQGKFTW